MRLRLQSYTDVFDRAGEEGVGETREGTGGVELGVGEGRWSAYGGARGLGLVGSRERE